jgi:hypothetical protein
VNRNQRGGSFKSERTLLLTNMHPQANFPRRQSLYLILLSLLVCGLGGCGDWHIMFSTPDVPPSSCPIQELMLDTSVLPGDDWQEIGSRSEKAASVRMGIEKIGTSFSTPIDGAFQEAYRFESERQANSAYKDSVESWFTPAEHETNWAVPQELVGLEVNADQYHVGCNDLKNDGFEQCQFVAIYGPYVIRFFAGMRGLSYESFIDIVKEVDSRATSCLGK